jgi:phosphate transport system substrate-binding protein
MVDNQCDELGLGQFGHWRLLASRRAEDHATRVKIFLALVMLGLSQLQGGVIRLKGSDTLGAKLVPQLCETYRAQHKEATFEVASEGTTSGIPGLLDGSNDILMASRVLKPKELAPFKNAGIFLQRADAVADVFVIVVNAENPVRDLSLAQLAGIFTGDHANWKGVGGRDAPVSIYTRNSASGSYKDFQLLAMNGRAYAKAANKLSGGDPPAMTVAKDPNGIGYVGLAYARAKGLAVVKIDGIDPLGKDIARYPLLRHCYYYYLEDARAEVLEFVKWSSSSPEARKIAVKLGFLVL